MHFSFEPGWQTQQVTLSHTKIWTRTVRPTVRNKMDAQPEPEPETSCAGLAGWLVTRMKVKPKRHSGGGGNCGDEPHDKSWREERAGFFERASLSQQRSTAHRNSNTYYTKLLLRLLLLLRYNKSSQPSEISSPQEETRNSSNLKIIFLCRIRCGAGVPNWIV